MIKPDFLYNRDVESHKGDYGHALLVAGSYGKMGAAVLAARACLRSGVGLLTVHVPRCGVDIMQTAVPEAMLSIDSDEYIFTSMPANLGRYDAVAMGPGLGTDERTQKIFVEMLSARKYGNGFRLVLDADALNILALHPEAMHLAEGAIITPHAKEYERLFADANPQAMAEMHGLVIVRKAHHTRIYSPGCEFMTNNTGNPGMATAGSGDVLTGITLGLLAQAVSYPQRHPSETMKISDVAALAVEMHGRAGDKAASIRPEASVVASDIVECLL